MKPFRPTHFLSLPIQDSTCHARASELANILLKSEPRPKGVDESLVVQPKSLHLTLGIMSLCGKRAAQRERRQGVQDEQEILQHAAKHGEIKSVDDAARLLQQCEKGLQEIVRNATAFRRKIDVRFDRLKSFQSDAAKCRVLYAEPEKAGSGTTLLHELGGKLALLRMSTFATRTCLFRFSLRAKNFPQ